MATVLTQTRGPSQAQSVDVREGLIPDFATEPLVSGAPASARARKASPGRTSQVRRPSTRNPTPRNRPALTSP